MCVKNLKQLNETLFGIFKRFSTTIHQGFAFLDTLRLISKLCRNISFLLSKKCISVTVLYYIHICIESAQHVSLEALSSFGFYKYLHSLRKQGFMQHLPPLDCVWWRTTASIWLCKSLRRLRTLYCEVIYS